MNFYPSSSTYYLYFYGLGVGNKLVPESSPIFYFSNLSYLSYYDPCTSSIFIILSFSNNLNEPMKGSSLIFFIEETIPNFFVSFSFLFKDINLAFFYLAYYFFFILLLYYSVFAKISNWFLLHAVHAAIKQR